MKNKTVRKRIFWSNTMMVVVTLLLIFGAYIPVITAVRGFLGLDFSYVPCLMFFGCGILAGAASVVKGIKVCLDKFRTQSVYMILGMMIGSFYAIILGPTTLEVPKPAMTLSTFQIPSFLVGIALVIGMQLIKERGEGQAKDPEQIHKKKADSNHVAK